MKTTYSKKELAEKAADFFKENPEVSEVFATTDGNIFLLKNRAELHAGPKGSVHLFTPDVPQEKTASTSSTPNAEATIALIEKVTTLEELADFEKDEKRKTVLAAIEKRKGELTPE